MRNIDVIQNFCVEKQAKSTNLCTDGKALYHYETCIANIRHSKYISYMADIAFILCTSAKVGAVTTKVVNGLKRQAKAYKVLCFQVPIIEPETLEDHMENLAYLSDGMQKKLYMRAFHNIINK